MDRRKNDKKKNNGQRGERGEDYRRKIDGQKNRRIKRRKKQRRITGKEEKKAFPSDTQTKCIFS